MVLIRTKGEHYGNDAFTKKEVKKIRGSDSSKKREGRNVKI